MQLRQSFFDGRGTPRPGHYEIFERHAVLTASDMPKPVHSSAIFQRYSPCFSRNQNEIASGRQCVTLSVSKV
jgi:hypothetical protein